MVACSKRAGLNKALNCLVVYFVSLRQVYILADISLLVFIADKGAGSGNFSRGSHSGRRSYGETKSKRYKLAYGRADVGVAITCNV